MKLLLFWCLSILFLLHSAHNVKSAKILGVFPIPSTSHFSLASHLMLGLAEKGHEIVIICPYSVGNKSRGLSYREVLLAKHIEIDPAIHLTQASIYKTMFGLYARGKQIAIETLEDPNVKSLLKSGETFDAVIVEQFHIEALKTLAWHYKAPLILFSTVGASSWLNHLVANPSPPSYIPDLYSKHSTEMTFFQRIYNIWIKVCWDYFFNNILLLPNHDKIAHRFFPDAPSLESIIYNTSLILLNSDVAVNPAIPMVPNMIDIGGLHVKPSKKLPDDLQKILETSKHGVIYFSMGSRLKSAGLSKSTQQMFLRVFSKLKHRVLWKWEEENLPGKPPNVEIRKWLPQSDILGHPNVKLFITHGGLLSKIETIYHGLPVLSIPVFGDQFMNAETTVEAGIGLRINYFNLTESYFEECIRNLLNDPKYQENAQKMSRILHDKPSKPLDTAIYWVEYVIRHKGAVHLQVAALKLSWYQYLLLDVAAFGVFLIVILLILSKSLIKLVSERTVIKLDHENKIKTS